MHKHSIEHFKGGKSIGLITPDTPSWRAATTNLEKRSAARFGRKRERVTFVPVNEKGERCA